jgi:hypothetical protein
MPSKDASNPCDWFSPSFRFESNSEVPVRNSAVRFTLKNRHHQPSLSGPRMGWTGRAPAPNRSENELGL